MDPYLIFDLICRSFTNPPLVCKNEVKDLTDSNPQGEPLNKYKKKTDYPTANDSNWVSILILTFGVIICIFVIYNDYKMQNLYKNRIIKGYYFEYKFCRFKIFCFSGQK